MANIVLVGFMGTGKTVVGKTISRMLNYELIDTDKMIEEESGMSISEIFEKRGEAYFRDLETDMAYRVSCCDEKVVSTGGGIVLRELNWKYLRKNGLIFCLNATPEEIWTRVSQHEHRPLLNVADPRGRIATLLAERRVFYDKADHQIETTGRPIVGIASEIISIFNDWRAECER